MPENESTELRVTTAVNEANSDAQAIADGSNEPTVDDIFAILDGMDEMDVEENKEQAEEFESSRKAWLDAIASKAIELQNDNNLDLREADIRFSTALDLRKVRNARVCIVGAGALGNWQWRILASMGFRSIVVYDDDTVGLENVGPQAHSIFDMGLPKVEAVANAALQYRGLRVHGIQKRVTTIENIRQDLGYCPDIIIGCTDSAEFRNNFIYTMETGIFSTNKHPEDFPELFLDYRMSLGDWVGYVIPYRTIISLQGRHRDHLFKYSEEAVFPPEEAVQEACTERAIAYTGANVAAFTGALLHWYYSGGREYLREEGHMKSFFSDAGIPPEEQGGFSWKTSFSARDWESITDTLQVKKLRRQLKKKEDEGMQNAEQAMYLLAKTMGFYPQDIVRYPWETIATEDWNAYLGDIFVEYSTGNMYLIVPSKSRTSHTALMRWGVRPDGSRDDSIILSEYGTPGSTHGVVLRSSNRTVCTLRKLFSKPEGMVHIGSEPTCPTHLRYRHTDDFNLRIEYCSDNVAETYTIPGPAQKIHIPGFHIPAELQETGTIYMDRRFAESEAQTMPVPSEPTAEQDSEPAPNMTLYSKVSVSDLSIDDIIYMDESGNEPLRVTSLSNGLEVHEINTGDVFYMSRRVKEVFRTVVEEEVSR